MLNHAINFASDLSACPHAESQKGRDALKGFGVGIRRNIGWVFFMAAMACFVLDISHLSAAEVVIIKSNDIAPYNQAIEGFTQEIGVKSGKYDLGGRADSISGIAGNIRRSPPRLIFALGALAAAEAKKKFPDIPVIYTLVFTPEGKELAGRNMSGIAIEVDSREQLSVFRKVIPEIKRIGVLYSHLTEQAVLKAGEDCRAMGLELAAVKLNHAEDVPEGIKRLAGRVDGLWLIPDSVVVNQDSLQYILLLTLENKIPFMVYNKNFVKAGALLAPVVDYTSIGRQAAKLARQVLQGGKLPEVFMPPAEVEWAVNMQTAQNLRLRISGQTLSSFKYVYK